MKIRKKKKEQSHLELTPLIDVVFLLLSFYMLTSTFNKSEGLPLELPTAEAAQLNENKTNTISIVNNTQVSVNDKNINISDLAKNLEDLDMKTHSFIIRSDKRSKVGTLVSVLDAIQSAGGNSVSIATEKN